MYARFSVVCAYQSIDLAGRSCRKLRNEIMVRPISFYVPRDRARPEEVACCGRRRVGWRRQSRPGRAVAQMGVGVDNGSRERSMRLEDVRVRKPL